MPTIPTLIAYTLVASGMVMSPGPNMIYLISRSISQGPRAGLVSLAGVATGSFTYMLCAAFGITALLFAVPFAYDALKIGGAIYLLYLAWQAIKPGGRSPFQVRDLPRDPPRKLYLMGLMTALLNPKVAILYLSLLPQFIHPDRGSVLSQSLILGSVTIVVSLMVNSMVAVSAGSIATFLGKRPLWLVIQRYLMATVLGGLAIRMATEARR